MEGHWRNLYLYERFNARVLRVNRDDPITLRVFSDINENMVTVAFERACKRAGILDFRFHDLRHTFASYLTMGGGNIRTVQALLGHKDLRMTMRYSHLSPKHLREAVSILDKGIGTYAYTQNIQEAEKVSSLG